MIMDSHSKNVCLIGILYIAGFLMEAIRYLYIFHYEHHFNESFLDDLPLMGYYALLAAIAGLMIRGVIKKHYILLVPFLVLSLIILILDVIPVSADIIQGGFDYFHSSIYRIAIDILTVYPTFTLFVELRSQSRKERPLEVASVEREKKLLSPEAAPAGSENKIFDV